MLPINVYKENESKSYELIPFDIPSSVVSRWFRVHQDFARSWLFFFPKLSINKSINWEYLGLFFFGILTVMRFECKTSYKLSKLFTTRPLLASGLYLLFRLILACTINFIFFWPLGSFGYSVSILDSTCLYIIFIAVVVGLCLFYNDFLSNNCAFSD